MRPAAQRHPASRLCSTPATVCLWPGSLVPVWLVAGQSLVAITLLRLPQRLARAAEPEQAREAERRRPKGGPGPPQHPSDDRHAPTALQPTPPQRGFCLHLLAVAQLGFCF